MRKANVIVFVGMLSLAVGVLGWAYSLVKTSIGGPVPWGLGMASAAMSCAGLVIAFLGFRQQTLAKVGKTHGDRKSLMGIFAWVLSAAGFGLAMGLMLGVKSGSEAAFARFRWGSGLGLLLMLVGSAIAIGDLVRLSRLGRIQKPDDRP